MAGWIYALSPAADPSRRQRGLRRRVSPPDPPAVFRRGLQRAGQVLPDGVGLQCAERQGAGERRRSRVRHVSGTLVALELKVHGVASSLQA